MRADKDETVELRAFGRDGVLLEELVLTVAGYYEELHDLIDSDEYRAAKGVVLVRGQIYNAQGALDQEFENRYSSGGAYVGGRSVFADGTVHED